MQAARGAFEAGKAAFNEADYLRAIFYWEDAFRRDCSAVLMLKNLARAYEASRQYPEAVIALQTYLARAPEAEDKAELEEQIRMLQAKTQHAGAAPATAPRPAAPKPEVARTQTKPPGAVVAQPEANDEALTDNTDADDKPVDGTKLAAGLIAGAGLTLGAASTLFWLDADADEEAATSECPTRRDCPDSVTDAGNEAIDRKQRWAIVGIGGGALLVGGVVWYLVASQGAAADEAAVPAVVPAVGPGFAGFTWTNQF